MRKYQPIWEAIKQSTTASLAADPSAHYRIIRAVRKEKDKDLCWKLECSEAGERYRLEDKSEGSLLSFILIDISPISIRSLGGKDKTKFEFNKLLTKPWV
jgi:hypothetical protein